MLRRWLLRIIVCSLYISILLYVGNFFEYTGNKVKLSAPAKIYIENEYIGWPPVVR
jgi:hypothetical protein